MERKESLFGDSHGETQTPFTLFSKISFRLRFFSWNHTDSETIVTRSVSILNTVNTSVETSFPPSFTTTNRIQEQPSQQRNLEWRDGVRFLAVSTKRWMKVHRSNLQQPFPHGNENALIRWVFFSFYNWVQLIFVGIARHRLITAILTPIFDLCAIRPAGNVSTIVWFTSGD